jgi:hypothetical protein
MQQLEEGSTRSKKRPKSTRKVVPGKEARPSARRARKGLAWAAVILAGLAGFGVFSWLGLLTVVTVAVWRLRSWPARWIAFPMVVVLPAVGLLAGTYGEQYADYLATFIFFALLSAVVVDVLTPSEPLESEVPVLARRQKRENAQARPFHKARMWVGARGDYVVVSLIATAAAQTWFRSGAYIAFGDLFPFLQGSALVPKSIPVWGTLSHGLGARSSAIVTAPVAMLERAFETLGGSGPLFERTFITGLFVAQALAIVFLIRTVWPSSRLWARMAGGLFFLFNLLGFFNLPGSVQMLAFAALPLMTGLMLRGLESGKIKYAYGWAFASLTLGYVAANLPLAAVTFAGSVILAVGIHLARAGPVRHLLRFCAAAFPLFLLFNLWWIVPAAITLLGATNLAAIPTSPEDWGWTHARNSFSNLFSLNAAWGWPQTIYYPYANSYLNPLMSVFIYAPASIACGCLALRRRTNGLVVPTLVGLALVLLFISKGIHEPYASVNESLLTDVPGMWVLREPASKLLPLVTVIFALLIVCCVDRAAGLMASRRRSVRRWWLDPAAGVCIVGIGLALIAWPIMTGHIVADERPVLPGVHISVPEHWEEAADVLNGQPEQAGAALLLPLSDFYQMPYEWGFYGADAMAPQLLKRPVIVGANIGYIPPSDEVQVAVARVERGIANEHSPTIGWSLRALGIKYVIVRGDIDYGLAEDLGRPIIPINEYLGSLFRNDAFTFIDRYGPLTLFGVADADVGPVAAWSRVEVSDTFDSMPTVARSSMSSAVVNSSESDWGRNGGAEPQLRVRSAGGSRYVVEVQDAKGPFVLSLNQAYDSQWNLSLPSSNDEPSHAIINGYANGWLIDRRGTYDVVIEFAPERVARAARAASLCGVVLTAGLLVVRRGRRRVLTVPSA